VTRLRLAPAAPPRQTLQGAAVALCLAVVAACGAPSGSSPLVASPEPGGSAVETPGAASPSPSEDPDLSAEPTASPSLSPGATPSLSTGGAAIHQAAECSGSDDNRTWFAGLADLVSWPVYCPVLPAGWVVDTGSYHLANGGRMEITYRNRSGQRLELREGAFCEDGSGCLPAGSDGGEAAFGDQSGRLVAADDGSWAVSVDGGEGVTWLAVGRSMDEATFRSYGEALIRIVD
jgi:hypothetical protein